MAIAGCVRATKVHATQYKVQKTPVQVDKAVPARIMIARKRKLKGKPRAIRRSACRPRRIIQGLARPQTQKVQSIATLSQNKALAACSELYPATLILHGIPHSVCMAIKPP